MFKKADRSLACNYRTVSLTCVPCNLLEHIVCSNIMSHLDDHKLLSDRQNAFRKSHSCETQLATVTDYWAKILDNQGQVVTFILDFEKKLLTLLRPLLFSLHINDITSDIESEIRLFADDCVCYREIKNVEDTVKLQNDIDRLGSWARKWGMRFQPVKCNMMQLTNKRTSKIQASYKLEGTVLENVESIKYLGVTITKDLKWNTHFSNVCTKANRTLVFLDEICFLAPKM